ncbi:WD repeat protein [Schizosaccharomyces japonicus yFS275]|uniref:WD repeat protein n=1 Tax=Schizosaccharomyces japonicus (strain yFS275 / FY16936) TaxID=402676 RepID=B6JYW2_SCHJY|nr:WD repeat protein [Schizosaccharomyces japonicus yFS275]EEB06730.2 WD repeat protein [Schizosaccharomyces japonicus yFS275]
MRSQNDNILCCNYNQDCSLLAVGTREGYKIYNCDPFGKCFQKAQEATTIIEMLFNTSLVALVKQTPESNSRKLEIMNTKRSTTICELTFPTKLLAVKLNRKRLVAVLEEQIYVYDISNMMLLYTIETCNNAFGVCALSADSENCYLVYPDMNKETATHEGSNGGSSVGVVGSDVSGRVVLWDAIKCQPVRVIEAHKNALSLLKFNATGTMLATVSEDGRIIRIFAIPSGERLFQFRRGTLPNQIHSIAFDPKSHFLAVTSDSQTMHVYRLDAPEPSPSKHSLLRRGSKSLVNAVGGYLPQSFTGVWDPRRHFAFAHIPGPRVRTAVAFSADGLYVNVATLAGSLLVFRLPLPEGGECPLVNHFSIGNVPV